MKILPSSEYDQILKYSVYWLVISIVIGVVAGLASTLIFVAFDISNKVRSLHHWLIYFLPFVGFLALVISLKNMDHRLNAELIYS